MEKILVINPGGTSTKVAYFEGEKEVVRDVIKHDLKELSKFKKITDQYELRKDLVLKFLEKNGIDVRQLSAVVGRGGLLRPLESGTYIINEKMIYDSKNSSFEHASNLGPIIAYEIAKPYGIPAYIVDPVVVDEMDDVARLSGLKEIPRASRFHALNVRMTAIKRAREKSGKLSDFNFIVVHIGSGSSVAILRKGKIVDVTDTSSEGPFGSDRSGSVPCMGLVDMCYSGKYTKDEIKKKLLGKGGLINYLGLNDLREVVKRIDGGDSYAKLVFEAMAYQIAKTVGAGAAALNGAVDEIILTGGGANSKMLVSLIEEKIKFIAPIYLSPGEAELKALCLGTLSVLRKEENAKTY